MKVLVVDDDPLVRRTLVRILRFGGHDVVEAENGVSGLELFRKETPDIVVTDIIMPEQEGLGMIMMMRRENPNAKIIAISGGGRVGNVDMLEAASALGAADVIHKPFDVDTLLGRIDRLTTLDSASQATAMTKRDDPGIALRRLAERVRAAEFSLAE